MKLKYLIPVLGMLAAACSPSSRQTDNEMNEFVDDLLGKMTVEEKLGQLNLLAGGEINTGAAKSTDVGRQIAGGNCGAVLNVKGVHTLRELQDIAVNETRLGIPLMFGMDVIHGYQTIFPIPLALSCSWDMEAIEKSARLAAREAASDGIDWTYSPMVDISRDPRWGRVAEGAGEDPYLGSCVARAMVRGYQGESLADTASVMACVKHFALYGASEAGRDYNTVDMSRQQMYNYYLPPYRAGAEAGAGSFMTSFNVIDFVPATANKWLINDVLRGEWGFDGFVVTDYTAIREMEAHGMGDLAQCSARALKAGTDMDMVSEGFSGTLAKALENGQVSQSEIDNAVRRVLEAKYKLGLFANPYLRLDTARAARTIRTPEMKAEARRITAETFVLLKNSNRTLPLKKSAKIALVGPYAASKSNLQGTWCVAADWHGYATLLDAFRNVTGEANVRYAPGCRVTDMPRMEWASETVETETGTRNADESRLLAEAVEAARWADVVVAAVGETDEFSGESNCMVNISLPEIQQRMLKALKATGKPVVMLNFAGRPTLLGWENENLDAILNVWFGGSEMADAITDVVFGDVAPSGKTTFSFPRAVGQIPVYYNHLNTGRPNYDEAGPYHKYVSNYLDCLNTPLYPFGYGLSYTEFSYDDFKLSAPTMTPDGSVEASCTVINTGDCDGTEIVQLYIRDLVASSSRPVKELKDFRRITLKKGESRTVTFTITPDKLKFYNYDLDYVLEPGMFHVSVGTNSRDTLEPIELNVTD